MNTSKIPTPNDFLTMPTAFRPGRLNNLEILERVFPLQRKSVLELVLQGCNGDLVKAIEHFLSAQDTLIAQHHYHLNSSTQNHDITHSQHSSHPYLNNTSFRPVNRHKLTFGGLKSAFTPLSPLAAFNGLHSAFRPHVSTFPPNIFRGQFLSHHHHHQQQQQQQQQIHSAGDILTSPSQIAYQNLSTIPTSSLSGIVASPFSLHSYRTLTIENTAISKMADKNSNKQNLTESDRISNKWENNSQLTNNAGNSVKDGD
ncbi:DMRT4_5 [Acanthosepion pharaonis]|uniref:DMRT4_5 n=1 Tax=Acanthosepion pharaonis TaxID=158019 RepID=A0A812AX00_ACAPH|nr:DMRT4_5 [Sepia pharaonis]